jgi:tRNA pseudouridine38-40 synthase
MVRIIAGTLLYVGKGRIKPEEIPEIIRLRDRVRAGITAAPRGLTLTYVNYDGSRPGDIFPDLES